MGVWYLNKCYSYSCITKQEFSKWNSCFSYTEIRKEILTMLDIEEKIVKQEEKVLLSVSSSTYIDI